MKSKSLLILTAICIILTTFSVLTSCGSDPPATPEKLSAPTVSLNENTASWEADPSAERFEISIDGDLSYLENTVTSKTLTDGQSFKIRAVGDGINHLTSDWSNTVTYRVGGTVSGDAPTYLGIIASTVEPSETNAPPASIKPLAQAQTSTSIEDAIKAFLSDSDNLLGDALPTLSAYDAYSKIGDTVYIQIWLDNPDQNTILSLKLGSVKYQSGGALQSFFIENGDTYLNCVYVAITIPDGSYGETSYEVTEIEYVEGSNVNQDGKAVMIDENNDTVNIGLPYRAYPMADCEGFSYGCHSASLTASINDGSNLVGTQGYWIRAILLGTDGVIAQKKLTVGDENNIVFDGLSEETEYVMALVSIGDKNDGKGLSYDILYSKSFTTSEVVRIEEDLIWCELSADGGRNAAKITLFADISYDSGAYFERVEVYKGAALVLSDDDFEGVGDYTNLDTKTDYTFRIYYSSDEHGYSERFKEINITTPHYELPEVNAYGSDKNIVVGNHALFGFSVERYTDIKYYDVIVQGYEQNDAYFAPFIIEMLDDPELLGRLSAEADRSYMKPGGYRWEAEYYMSRYLEYLSAWEHKEHTGYSDSYWYGIASNTEQYTYTLSVDNGGLFIANDGDVVYNYYAILCDYFDYEDLRFDIYLSVDLGDGAGLREIKVYNAYPYFRKADNGYNFRIEEDKSLKNTYVFTEGDSNYGEHYVYKLALYKDGELVSYVPFNSDDITYIDNDAWLNAWIEKLKAEIPDATEREMIELLGPDIVSEIFNSLDFKEELGDDIVSDGTVGASVDTRRLGNATERELLMALKSVDGDTLLSLFKQHSSENITLDAFISESESSVIVAVLNDYRRELIPTDANAYAIYSAINSVYDVVGELKSSYESHVREEYASKVIPDLIEEIPAISFKINLGTDLAPKGGYELRVLYRSILKDYVGDEVEDYYTHYVTVREELKAPENITLSGRRLSWDAVEGAGGYKIYVGGEIRFTVLENYYDNYGDLLDGDRIRIVAVGDYAYDSEPSDEFTYVKEKLASPSLTVNGYWISWQRVEGATKYVYEYNGGSGETADTSVSVYASGSVRIKAVDAEGIYLDSDWSTVTVSGSADKEK